MYMFYLYILGKFPDSVMKEMYDKIITGSYKTNIYEVILEICVVCKFELIFAAKPLLRFRLYKLAQGFFLKLMCHHIALLSCLLAVSLFCNPAHKISKRQKKKILFAVTQFLSVSGNLIWKCEIQSVFLL